MNNSTQQEPLSPRGIRILCTSILALPLVALALLLATVRNPPIDPEAQRMFQWAFWVLLALEAIVALYLRRKLPENTTAEQQTKAVVLYAQAGGMGMFAATCSVRYSLWSTWIGFAVLAVLVVSLARIDPERTETEGQVNAPA